MIAVIAVIAVSPARLFAGHDIHKCAADLWQYYVAGPESCPDLAKWRTGLNRPLED